MNNLLLNNLLINNNFGKLMITFLAILFVIIYIEDWIVINIKNRH